MMDFSTKKEKALCLFVIALSLFQCGYSLQCYVCDSIMMPDCHDLSASSDKFLVNCTKDKFGMTLKNPICFQAHGKVNFMIAEGEAVMRGCTENTKLSTDACADYQLPYRFAMLGCKTCNTTRCNGDYIATAAPALRIVTPPPRSRGAGKGGAGSVFGVIGLVLSAAALCMISSVP